MTDGVDEWVFEDIHEDPTHREFVCVLEEARLEYESGDGGEIPCGICGRASTMGTGCGHNLCDGCNLRCVKVHRGEVGFKLLWQCPMCRSEERVDPMTLRLWLYVAGRVAVFEAAGDGVPVVAVLRPCEQGCYMCAGGGLLAMPLPM